MPAGGSLFCFQLAFALSLGHRLSSHIAFSPLSLVHRLGFAARPASARCPVLPYVREREKLPFLPLPVDPGNFLLSQAVPSSVPSAFGGLTSVFGMGTGGALQLSSPETFPGALSRFLSAPLRSSLPLRVPSARFAPLPAPSKLHRSELTSKLTLSFVFLGSSPRPISIGKLHASQRFHRRPIYLIVSEGSYLL